jgi:hypothetical protein
LKKKKRKIKKDKPTRSEATTTTKNKPTKTRKAEKNDDMSSLIAQIQSKKRGGSGASTMADFAARYGVTDDIANDDPLADDAAFQRAQAKVTNKKQKKLQKR